MGLNFKNLISVLVVFLSLDLLILLLYLVFPNFAFFNLDLESNLPTIYQGLKLILVGSTSCMVLVLLYILGKDLLKNWFWIFWSLLFVFLGLDEIGEIHENISTYIKEIFGKGVVEYEEVVVELGYSSTPWLLYYSLFFVIATVLVCIYLRSSKSKNNLFLIVGWIFFVSVLIVEYVNTKEGIMFNDGYVVLMCIEEMLEMIGASFLLYFSFLKLFELISVVKKRLKVEY